jgi:hypothetical protein
MQRRTNRKRKELKASSRERDRDFFFLFCVDIGTSFESVGALEKGGGGKESALLLRWDSFGFRAIPFPSLSLSLSFSHATHISSKKIEQ